MTRKSAAPTYLREATLTYRAVRGAPRDLFPEKPIASSAHVDRLLRPMLAGRITESLVVLALTGRQTVIGLHEVARGAVNHVHCAPCDLFRYPLMAGAVSLILAHNHPSGDAAPSPEDLALTQRTVRLGFELGLSVLDHVIVVQDGYFSLLDAGLLRAGIEDGGGQSTWAKGRAARPYGVSGNRFALGQVCVTPGVLGSCSSERIAGCLRRHARGD